MNDTRLTTREAREVLGARNAAETIAILRAARVPATRCGGAWLTIRLPARRRGGRRGPAVGADVAPGGPDTGSAPTPERIPRLARVLALAHHWQGLIRSGAVRDQADLARLVGVSRARVTQVMNLLWLAPDLQAEVLQAEGGSCAVSQRDILPLAAEPVWQEQRRRWSERARIPTPA